MKSKSMRTILGIFFVSAALLFLTCAGQPDAETDAAGAAHTSATTDPGVIEVLEIAKVEEELMMEDVAEALAYQPSRNRLAKDVTGMQMAPVPGNGESVENTEVWNTEDYSRIYENPFKSVTANPLSTFSIDVDTASYANVRRFLSYGDKPYPDAVRIEEMINYFSYDYPEPRGVDPFEFTTELTESPWNPNNKLLLVGLQGQKMDLQNLPPSNIVFLLDVSGSMEDENKLPLLRKSLALLLENLRPQDTISIVVYAGAAGLVLPPTPASDRQEILTALNDLQAGGSTAGGAGIELAYKMAKENFIPQGNNRIILCTDGDFNVGPSSQGELVRMIEEKREEGIFLTVLGFGMGNYKDSTLENLADKGNGNYGYIDNLLEAKKMLVTDLGGTLLTIAKDVKLQIEFNPAKVKEYRLIGYENRVMAAEDFDNDKKDAGELGAGHNVTALYELVMNDGSVSESDNLKYTDTTISDEAYSSDELFTIKFRYKRPDGDTSKLIEKPVTHQEISFASASDNIVWAAAVAEFGMILRGSEHKGSATYDDVIALAKRAEGPDLNGYRAEFIRLVETARSIESSTEEY